MSIPETRQNKLDIASIRAVLQKYGTTAQRVAGLATADTGFLYYDTTIGKPIWWSGSSWKDATGTIV